MKKKLVKKVKKVVIPVVVPLVDEEEEAETFSKDVAEMQGYKEVEDAKAKKVKMGKPWFQFMMFWE